MRRRDVLRLRVGGSDLAGIHYLHAFGNSDAIREDAGRAERVVVVGGSYIGCEVAATPTAMGRPVTMVMQEQVVLERPFAPDVGRFFQGVLREHGVTVVGGDELECFEGGATAASRWCAGRSRTVSASPSTARASDSARRSAWAARRSAHARRLMGEGRDVGADVLQEPDFGLATT